MLAAVVLVSAITIKQHAIASLKSPAIQTSGANRQAALNDSSSRAPHASQSRVVAAYGKLPLSFEINQGQTDSRAKFRSRASGYALFLTENEAVLTLKKNSRVGSQKMDGADLPFGSAAFPLEGFSEAALDAAPLPRSFPLRTAVLTTTSRVQLTPQSVEPSTSSINQIRSNWRSIATGLSSLPLEAQSSISRVLGRDVPGYQARAQGRGFTAENTRNNLSAEFTPAGVEMRSGNALWKLALRSYGYSNALQPLPAAIPQVSSNRVEYRHGTLTEWYMNGPLGLEQGFTLSARPRRPIGPDIRSFGLGNMAIDNQQLRIGDYPDQPLTIALTASGNLTMMVDKGRTGLILKKREGQAQLRYTGLAARDSTGKQLRAWLEVQGELLLLKVEDAAARYPVVIDPFTQLAKLTPSDPGDVCCSVAVSGDTVVAGAIFAGPIFEQGAAYVFVKPASGWANMTETAKLTASDSAFGDWFGGSVAISGGTVVIGASQGNSLGLSALGKAYVFVKPANGWSDMTQTAELTASDGKPDDQFGQSVGIDGNTAIVGTRNSQAAYVFVEPANGWKNMSETAKLTPSGGNPGQSGFSVAISGNTAVAGRTGDEAAYVFVKPTTGWSDMTQTAKLMSSDDGGNDHFGFSAANGC